MALLATLGVVLILIGGVLHQSPTHWLSVNFNDQSLGWLFVGVGLIAVATAIAFYYMRTHTAHAEQIRNNSAPGANVFDGSRY